MASKLNSDAAAATAVAAAGPRSGQALADQIVQRARDGAAQGEPDYLEVRGWGSAGAGRPPAAAAAAWRQAPRRRARSPPLPLPSLLLGHLQEGACDFQGQQFTKCKPLMKLVGADNPQVCAHSTAKM